MKKNYENKKSGRKNEEKKMRRSFQNLKISNKIIIRVNLDMHIQELLQMQKKYHFMEEKKQKRIL